MIPMMKNDIYFSSYLEKQFFIAMIAEDPWNYLRAFRIPSDIIVLSGLRGLKRKRSDVETIAIGDYNSGFSILNEHFIVTKLKVPRIRETIIPYVAGEIKKSTIAIWRDPADTHPLYFSRLPDGFVFSTRKEWIWRMGFSPQPFPLGKKALIDNVSISFTPRSLKNENLLDVLKGTLSKIWRIVKKKIDVEIILNGVSTDLLIIKLLNKIAEESDFLTYHFLVPDTISSRIQNIIDSENLRETHLNDHLKEISHWIELSESYNPFYFLMTYHLLGCRKLLSRMNNTIFVIAWDPSSIINESESLNTAEISHLYWISFKLLWPAKGIFIPHSMEKIKGNSYPEKNSVKKYLRVWNELREQLRLTLVRKAREKNLKNIRDYLAIIFKSCFPFAPYPLNSGNH